MIARELNQKLNLKNKKSAAVYVHFTYRMCENWTCYWAVRLASFDQILSLAEFTRPLILKQIINLLLLLFFLSQSLQLIEGSEVVIKKGLNCLSEKKCIFFVRRRITIHFINNLTTVALFEGNSIFETPYKHYLQNQPIQIKRTLLGVYTKQKQLFPEG